MIQVTYRMAVQSMIAKLQEVYDHAEALRDYSSYGKFGGKDHMNKLRGDLPDVWNTLQSLDNNMPPELANMIVWEEKK